MCHIFLNSTKQYVHKWPVVKRKERRRQEKTKNEKQNNVLISWLTAKLDLSLDKIFD